MVVEIADDRHLPAVERGVAESVNPVVRDDLQRDEIAPRAGYDHARFGDPRHQSILAMIDLVSM